MEDILAFIAVVVVVTIFIYFNERKDEKPVTKIPQQPIEPLTQLLTDEELLPIFLEQKQEYLKSKEWKDKRRLVLLRDNHKCTCCGTYQNLTVHHDSGYNLIPNEPTSALRTLCRSCHTAFHKQHGFPKTYQDYMTWNTKDL